MSDSPSSPQEIRVADVAHAGLRPECNDAMVASFLELVDQG
jgi:hypothetical protein